MLVVTKSRAFRCDNLSEIAEDSGPTFDLTMVSLSLVLLTVLSSVTVALGLDYSLV